MVITKSMSDDLRDGQGKFTPGNPYAWTPGRSGNPKGRPKGSKSGSAVLRKMARQLIDPKTGLNATELISAKLISAAMSGEAWAIKEYFDRVEGRPGVRVETEEEYSWQELAEIHGLSEEDVISEARKLIESGLDPGDERPDQTA
jgi:hypothetical protein